MSLKTKIKNDMWQVNYVVPFVKKHQFDEKGKAYMLRHVAKAYSQIKAVRSNGKRSVGRDTKVLLESVAITLGKKSRFVYFLDVKKTIAVPGNILSNFTWGFSAYFNELPESYKDLLIDRALAAEKLQEVVGGP